MGAWCLKDAPKGVVAYGGHRELDHRELESLWVHLMGAWCLRGAPKGVIVHGGATGS
jgi:hypothetical protein